MGRCVHEADEKWGGESVTHHDNDIDNLRFMGDNNINSRAS